MANKKCYNCKHGGYQFKINGKTQLHCFNKNKYNPKDIEEGEISHWDTLSEFWDTCDQHTEKTLK